MHPLFAQENNFFRDDYVTRAVLWTPIPEPNSYGLVTMGLAVAAFSRRRAVRLF